MHLNEVHHSPIPAREDGFLYITQPITAIHFLNNRKNSNYSLEIEIKYAFCPTLLERFHKTLLQSLWEMSTELQAKFPGIYACNYFFGR